MLGVRKPIEKSHQFPLGGNLWLNNISSMESVARLNLQSINVAGREGIEPPTLSLGRICSVHLSYPPVENQDKIPRTIMTLA